ncbi:hypothetical protein R5R35_004322 [Gryllus longicercus]|uniref:BHLH domain-containing protein n=1 Tax=Gryllus longicercus TaxID=2509291 RepID=A0AAN9VVQ9_9ORTH
MKAVCANTPSGGSVANGRVHRPRRDVENEEIQMYLSKLKELVPFMPRNRKLSKLEVIQYVIDYICDLQYALETHPAVATTGAPTVAAAAAAAAASATAGAAGVAAAAGAGARPAAAAVSPRQPLGVLAPNALLPNTPCAAQEAISTTPAHLEKVSPSDSRPVSC